MARVFASVKGNLLHIQLFHTDRGSEFKNRLIDETLVTFQKKTNTRAGYKVDNYIIKGEVNSW